MMTIMMIVVLKRIICESFFNNFYKTITWEWQWPTGAHGTEWLLIRARLTNDDDKAVKILRANEERKVQSFYR